MIYKSHDDRLTKSVKGPLLIKRYTSLSINHLKEKKHSAGISISVLRNVGVVFLHGVLQQGTGWGKFGCSSLQCWS